MSRSRKALVWKQKQHPKDKQIAVRRVRYKAKNLEEDIADGKAFRKESNSWDICDWSWMTKDKKAGRK